MKNLDPNAAAAVVKSAVDNALIMQGEIHAPISSDFVIAVCKALDIDDSAANLVLVTRELVHFGIRPHYVHEYPKMIGETEDKKSIIAESAAHEAELTGATSAESADAAPTAPTAPSPSVPDAPKDGAPATVSDGPPPPDDPNTLPPPPNQL